MKTKPKQESWEKEFDTAFADGAFFFTGPVDSDFQPFLEWCKGLLRKTLQKERQRIRKEVEKQREDGKQLSYGIVRTQRLRLQTLKALGTEGGTQMAYEDGWNAALDQVLKLLEDKDV